MEHLAPDTTNVAFITLAITFFLILFQEAVNGFHDVANAIATVIYSRAMSPRSSVLMAAVFNFIGVLFGGTAVAFSMVYLLPTNMVTGINTMNEVSLFMAMIFTAVVWNFGTWWLGIPNSTTHAYIGSIIGISMADAFLMGQPVADQINWGQGEKILMALIVSPIVGFLLGVIVLKIITWVAHDKGLYEPSKDDHRPSAAIRGILIAGAAGVSLLHGSNDGQKSIGLMMVALFGLFPAAYGLDPDRLAPEDYQHLVTVVQQVEDVRQATAVLSSESEGKASSEATPAVKELLNHLSLKQSGLQLSDDEAIKVRKEILAVHRQVAKQLKAPETRAKLSQEQLTTLEGAHKELASFVEYVPIWVMVLSAMALGGGTLIGYKKIVTTLGEKIGSSKMNPAQGTAAQASAVMSIALADFGGLPVSTTHVLSSAVVGTVVGTQGQQVNQKTIASIALTWVTTLPGTLLLSFAMGIVFNRALG
ncbi:MAG: anion permease [Methylococcus sp.]|jgi:phosphate/sulfate permease|nr:MAG: anion permease [Methylococcus sp.]